MCIILKYFIRAEGLIPRPLGAYEGYKIPTAIPLENNNLDPCVEVVDWKEKK
jgi:hypothetical protein